MATATKLPVLNFNVGVLGHIDSGKTSLSKALSTVPSTASFDKHPQSRERGITLDLGFSSFSGPLPEGLKDSGYGCVQYTMVDCPGHASLIRTIIGGAQIIDLMLLVIDVTKGIQTQTAECLVIGEITCEHMIVVLNKVDLIEPSKMESQIAKVTKRISKTLQATRFAGCPIVPVAAKPGGPEAPSTAQPVGVDNLMQVLSDCLFVPQRSSEGPLVFSVDHCFPIRGQGTVMTGTVLSGAVAVNDTVEIPFLKVTKKVKSMQMFHQPVSKAVQGDRVGICVTQFDPKQVERCLVSSPGHLHTIFAGVFRVHKVPYHKMDCKSGTKLHVTLGHDTLMATTTFFSGVQPKLATPTQKPTTPTSPQFDASCDYIYQELLANQDSSTDEDTGTSECHYALLEFEKPVICPQDSIIIGSRLDTDVHSHMCRIAFHGRLLLPIRDKSYQNSFLPQLKVYKLKKREGVVERVQDSTTIIGKGLFKKETNIDVFTGMRVHLSTGEDGVIDGSFGKTGKFRVVIPGGLKDDTQQQLATTGVKKRGKGKGGGGGGAVSSDAAGATGGDDHSLVCITLTFKRYIFDPQKKMKQ